jgi:hypothetical protein
MAESDRWSFHPSAEEVSPNGMHWRAQSGRSEVRLPWWRAGERELTWSEAALVPNDVRAEMPDTQRLG